MKKFLIAVLLLIPVLVVLAILASSAVITISGTPINPESMEIKDEFNVDFTGILEMDIYGGNEFINIYIYPTVAKDRSVTFTKVADSGEGEVNFEYSGNNKYIIVPVKVGVAEYIVRPTANVSIYKTITVNITSVMAEKVVIYNAQSEEIGENYNLTGSERLYAEAVPLSSMESVTWSVGDESIVYVDANGMMYPTGHGSTIVQALLVDKKGDTHMKSITVNTRQAVAKCNTAYCVGEVDSQWVLQNIAVDPRDTSVKDMGNGRFELSANIGTETFKEIITVEEKTGNELIFVDSLEEIYLNYTSEYLQVGYSDSIFKAVEGAKFSSSDSSVAMISNSGKITPIGVGNCTVTAYLNGMETSKSITVKERPAIIKLNLGAADATRGIERTRVWGKYTYRNGELTEGVELKLLNESKNYDLLWESTGLGEMQVSADECGVALKFADGDLGNAVKVSATLLMGERLVKNISASFTFNVVEEEASANIYDVNGMEKACQSDTKRMQMILQSDLSPTHTFTCRASLYGNGFTIDGSQIKYGYAHDAILTYAEWSINSFGESFNDIGNVFVKNVKIQCYKYDEFSFDNQLDGQCINTSHIDVPFVLKYCELEYAHTDIEIYACVNCTVEGCIFGDAQRGGIYVLFDNESDVQKKELNCDYEMRLRNNVFKKTNLASVLLSLRGGTVNYEENYLPNVYIEGFFDCYNWKTREEVPEMMTNFIKSCLDYDGDINPDAIMNLLSSTIEDLVENSTIPDMFTQYNGKEYGAFGCIVLGVIFNPDLSKIHNNYSETNLKEVDFTFNDTPMINAFDMLLPSVISGVKTVKHKSIIMATDFTQSGSNITPDSDIPASEALYARLRGE